MFPHFASVTVRLFCVSLSQNVNRDLKISDDSGRASLLALEVFSQTIKSLKYHFENTVTGRALQFDPGNVLYVVTVPAIWKQSAKLFMKEAAMQVHVIRIKLASLV